VAFLFLSIKHIFDLAEEALSLGVILVVGIIVKLAEELFLLFAQVLWDLNGDLNILVACASAVDAWNTLALELKDIAGLGALMDAVAYLAVESRNLNIVTQSSLSESDRHIEPYVVATALKNSVGANCDEYLKVTVRTAVGAGVTLSANSQYLIVINTCCDVDLNGLLASYTALAVTGGAWCVDDLTAATASVAGAGALHHAERCSLVDADLTCASAVGAGLGLGALSSACAVTVVAVFDLLICYGLLAALSGLLKGDDHRGLTVGTLSRSVGIGASAAAESTAEHIENIGEVESACSATPWIASGAAAEVGVYACMTKLVIAGLFIFIRKYLVGLVGLLEFGLSLLITGMKVRMILLGTFSVGFLDLVV